MVKPNFFVMGAPKCGTTFLYSCLRQHPEIYIPKMKEIHFFGDDLPFRQGLIKRTIRSQSDYLSLFSKAKKEKAIGEVGIWYLYSKKAPQQIKEFSPRSKAIVMLRNPIKAAYSLHNTLVFNNKENLEDFREAWAAEEERKKGRMIPPNIPAEEAGELFYRDIFKYSSQLKRLFSAFKKEEVLVIIFDDLKKNAADCYKKVMKFLGTDSRFQPEFKVVNPSKEARFKKLGLFLHYPPSFIRQLAIKTIPRALLLEIFHKLRVLNSYSRPLPPMNPAIKKTLQQEFRADIDQVGRILGRDLSFWYKNDL
jgi:hypothetical protein